MLARTLDPSQIAPLRRGPIRHRMKEPDVPWSVHASMALWLGITLLGLAGLVWSSC